MHALNHFGMFYLCSWVAVVQSAKIKISSVSVCLILLHLWSLALNYVQKLGPPSNWWPWIDFPRTDRAEASRGGGGATGAIDPPPDFVEIEKRTKQKLKKTISSGPPDFHRFLQSCRYLALCLPMKIDRCCCFWFHFPRYLLGFKIWASCKI